MATAESLESLRASFNRRLRAEGKADRTQSYGADVVVERSSKIVWPEDPGLPQRL